MDGVGAPPRGRSRVVTAETRVPGADPLAFLRRAAPGSRGFWARRGRWVAHCREAASIVVPAGRGTAERFRIVRDRAATLLGDGAPPRLFGGFSFRDDPRAEAPWGAFPSARFVLPGVELEGGGEGPPTLRVRAVLPEDADAAPVAAALGQDLRDAARSLATTGPEDGPAGSGEATPPGGRAAPVRATARETDRGAWEDAIGDVLDAVSAGSVEKVVLARTLDVTTSVALDPLDVVTHLWRQNPGTHVFLFEPEAGAALVGAAPETVATLRGRDFHATAVAGSIPRGSTEGERERLARRLLASGKDRVEHAIAVQDMVARLGPLASRVESEGEPHVLALARIQHLETRIRARIQEGHSVLDLLAALHPTPAVCGFPRDAALELLAREEPFERGWYAGPVGWFDAAGDGVFAPALRSAVAHGRKWRLFAGAGIVAGSRPELEWEETAMKFDPVLRALEACGAGGLAEGG